MRERILLVDQRAAYLEALEKLLQARIGWVNSAISPFAQAAHIEPVAHIEPAQAAPTVVGTQAKTPVNPPRDSDARDPDTRDSDSGCSELAA